MVMPNYTPIDIARLDIRQGVYMISPENGGVVDMRDRYGTGFIVPIKRLNSREPIPRGVPIVWFYRGESAIWTARWSALVGDENTNPVGVALKLPSLKIGYI